MPTTTSPLSSILATTNDGGPGPAAPASLNANNVLQVRDILSGLVGKNIRDLSNGDTRNNYAWLSGQVGPRVAQKLVTHAIMFNQRDDMAALSPEKRVQRFYDIGSDDPETKDILSHAGTASYGPLEGLQSSPDMLNRQASGRAAKDQEEDPKLSPMAKKLKYIPTVNTAAAAAYVTGK